jgi:hypothetical protein
MSTIQKVALGIVGIGMATAVLLPDRQTVPVLGAVQKLFSGSLNTAIEG